MSSWKQATVAPLGCVGKSDTLGWAVCQSATGEIKDSQGQAFATIGHRVTL